MHRIHLELWLSALVMAVIGAVYLAVIRSNPVPAAGSLVGHGLGILGFVLMLMTETLYSIRKRYQFARWGKLQNWLSFHIFTGLVGPFLVLLHTSWKFQGLAGVLTLMTLIMVASGFVGRYFYTSIPRDSEGTALEILEIQTQIEEYRQEIHSHQTLESATNPPSTGNGDSTAVPEPNELQSRQNKLLKQLAHLERSRKLLALWHTFHVPLGLSLFLIAIVHISAALYYSTLLH